VHLARDKRALARIACDGPCDLFFDGSRRQGTLANVSAFGVYVALSGPLPPVQRRLVLTFYLPGEAAPLACEGWVRWLNEPSTFKGSGSMKPGLPPGFGVEFLGMDTRDRERIAATVRAGMGHEGSRARFSTPRLAGSG
jgi:PilZ domain-containing protein